MITFAEARRLSNSGNVIPLVMRLPSDLETPLSAYLKLCRSGTTHGALLESVAGGESVGRYSIVAASPYAIVTGDRELTTIRRGKQIETIEESPYAALENIFAKFTPVRLESLPPFTGGGIGYFSYETVRWLEALPSRHRSRLPIPLMQFGLYDSVVCFDHLRQELIVIVNVMVGGEKSFRLQYQGAVDRLERMIRQLAHPVRVHTTEVGRAPVRSLCSQRAFYDMVAAAKQHIRDGDIFQVVLSRRWRTAAKASAVDVYRRLRRVNPSPYMYLLRLGELAVVGSSPEMLVRVINGEIETRPIAGTRPRGSNAAEDAERAASLLSDPKELAEHTMLVDLGRNDLGRVAVAGSVHVPEQMSIEKYSHVMHIVSSVKGRLAETKTALQAHAACFPAGTVSGAPKVRAMQIIDQLEPHSRDLYAGTIGYLDFWGNLDSCIAIRTAFQVGKDWYLQAGAGIVADSDPEREFLETEAKVRGVLAAVTGRDA